MPLVPGTPIASVPADTAAIDNVTNAPLIRTALGLGTAAVATIGTGAGEVPVTGDYVPADGAPVAAHAEVTTTPHTVELDSALGRYLYLSLNGSGAVVATLTGKISPEPVDGKKLYLRVKVGANGGTLIMSTNISNQTESNVPWDTTGKVLTASKTYELLFMYNTDLNKWCFLSFTGGFA